MEEPRTPTYEELLEEIAVLKQRDAEKDAIIADLKAQIESLKKMLFGKKSEKSKKSKKPDTEKESNDPTETQNSKKKHGGGGRKPFPPNIPRREVHVSLHSDECRCASCGKDYVPMGVEITEVMNYIPMVLEVIRFIRQRMKPDCDCFGNKIIIAEMPIRNIDHGSVTTEFVAAVLVNKYCDHLPVHRQVGRLLKSAKVEVAESSVCRWRDTVADQLEGLAELMKSEIKESYCVNTDASPAPVRLPNEKNRIATGNMYVYIGGADRPYNVFDVQPNQTAAPIYEFLKGYSKRVQCDAHGNYNALFNPGKHKRSNAERLIEGEAECLGGRSPEEVGCNAHCRRGFVEAENDEPEWVKRFLNLYKKLYKIEAEIKESSIGVKYERRQVDSVPILDAFFDLCRECQNDPLILPKSRLGQACAYALNNEAALRRYCTDGRLNIDNNISERTLREFVIGRKNWLFFGSPESAKKSAIIMTVLSSARRHGLDEWEYLVDVLYRLSDWNPRVDSLDNLLPDRWVKSPTPPTEAAALIAR